MVGVTTLGWPEIYTSFSHHLKRPPSQFFYDTKLKNKRLNLHLPKPNICHLFNVWGCLEIQINAHSNPNMVVVVVMVVIGVEVVVLEILIYF